MPYQSPYQIPSQDELKKHQITDELKKKAEALAEKYSESPYHTNAGRWIRFAVRFLPVDIILKMLQAKIKKQ